MEIVETVEALLVRCGTASHHQYLPMCCAVWMVEEQVGWSSSEPGESDVFGASFRVSVLVNRIFLGCWNW